MFNIAIDKSLVQSFRCLEHLAALLALNAAWAVSISLLCRDWYTALIPLWHDLALIQHRSYFSGACMRMIYMMEHTSADVFTE